MLDYYTFYLAKILGLYVGIIGLAFLVQKDKYQKAITQFAGSPIFMAITGFVSLIIGVLIVTSHNLWIPEWPIIITLIGWFFFLQGILRLFAPDKAAHLMKKLQHKNHFVVMSWIWVVIGAYLCFMGFFY